MTATAAATSAATSTATTTIATASTIVLLSLLTMTAALFSSSSS